MAKFQSLLDSIKNQTTEAFQQFSNIVDMTMPAFQAVFIVYCMFVIWSYWENESSIQGTFIDLMKRIVAWGLILSLGMNAQGYANTVLPFVRDLGTDLAQGYAGSGSDNTFDAVIDKLIQVSETAVETVLSGNAHQMEVASEGEAQTEEREGFWDKATGMMSDAKDAVVDTVTGITGGMFEAAFGTIVAIVLLIFKLLILWAFALPFILISAAYMFIAQIMLVILAAIGPIFFGFALFPATRTYFTNWIGQVLNYGFYFLIVTVTVRLAITMANAELDALVAGMMDIVATAGAGAVAGVVANPMDAAISFQSLIYLVAIFGLFIVVIFQIPSLTSQLFGGLAVGGFSQVVRAAAAAKTGGLATVAAGKSAAKAVASKVRGTNNMKAENAGKG